jgi:enoyl-CoA hydratase
MTTTDSFRSLRVERAADGVVDVVLIGPGKGNAMGPDFWREMPELFGTLDADEGVRAIVIRGDGKHFSYGLDLLAMSAELGPLIQGNNLALARTRLLDLIGRMQSACDLVARCRKPVIAAIHGWCIGGGLDLASACDIRLASKDARISLREVKVAMVADIGSIQRLPRIIGDAHARELAYTGKDIDATRALRIGLVNDVFDTPEDLVREARSLARSIAENPPLVVQGIKQVMDYCADKSLADGLRYVAVWNAAFLQSHDLGEAMAAFVEKRPAVFKGE